MDATVRPGNSGGPLLTTDGQVYGMVFDRSATYQLADQGVRTDIQVRKRAVSA